MPTHKVQVLIDLFRFFNKFKEQSGPNGTEYINDYHT